jgi:hypothetical protein
LANALVSICFYLIPLPEPRLILGGVVGLYTISAVAAVWIRARRFGRRVRRFGCLSNDSVQVRYKPEAGARVDVQRVLQMSDEALRALSSRLSCRLRRRLVVFLFNHHAEISSFFGTRISGGALIGGDAVVLAADALGAMKSPAELIRHEIAHLLSYYWGKLDPPLKGEGLATWAQEQIEGKDIDLQALACLVGNACVPLWMMLWGETFRWQIRSVSYALAGSFTRFLIQRFGLECYRDWFRTAGPKNFEHSFEKSFGMSLIEAEREWRKRLLDRRSEFEPELSRAAREQSIRAAYQSWQLIRCVEEGREFLLTPDPPTTVLWCVTRSHQLLGNYEEALAVLFQFLERCDAASVSHRATAWLNVGQIQDLQGKRDEAVLAYRKALSEVDCWEQQDGSCHQRARIYLRRPFTEREFLGRWRGSRKRGRWGLRRSRR